METYIKQFSSLHTAIKKGKPAPHKAILLLSVIDLIASGKLQTTAIQINDELKQRFKQNWRTYVNDGREGGSSLIRTPFTYMNSEPFWDLTHGGARAQIDKRLFDLLRIEENQHTLRDILVSKYLNREATQTPHKVDFSELNAAKDQSLRPYQILNKQKIYKFWENGRTVMLQMPTGTGKTRLFVSIVRDLHEWGAAHNQSVKVLLLAHRVELIQQISENLGLRYKLAHGVIASNNPENHKYPIQVGSVPTMHRRMNKWADKDFDVIIVDEAHHVKADSYKTILKEYPNAKVLGVTATPYRLNGAGFRDIFQDLILSDSVSTFIKNGYLSNYDYYSIPPDSSVQKQIEGITEFDLNGDYRESAMMRVMDTDRLRARIVDTYLRYAKGKKGIIYTINQLHNQNVCAQFIANGIAAKAIDSRTKPEIRKEIVEDFRNGKFQILCNVNIFSEGFDCPDLEFVQLARPTKSLSMFLQQIGRGLRTAEDKEKVIFLDNVGLYNRFGLPAANRKWRMHFEGQEVSELDLKGEKSLEEDDVRFMDDIEEGDEKIELVHSTLGVGEYTVLSNDEANELESEYMEKKEDSLRTIEEVEHDIAVFERYGTNIPEELLNERKKIQQDKMVTQLTSSIKMEMSKLFQNIDFEVSFELNYSPENGLVITQNSPSLNNNQIREENQDRKASDAVLFITVAKEGRVVQAKGTKTKKGFTVFENSVCPDSVVPSFSEGYKKLRKALVKNGTIIKENGVLIFSKDYCFNSATEAAAIVMGRPASGLITWKDKDGKTLKEMEE